jgi:hypothetical protein
MTSAGPTAQTNCVTERCALARAGEVTMGRSGYVDMTTTSATGGDRWTSTNPSPLENADGPTITGTSAAGVVSIGEQFQFPMPGNG